MSDTEWEPSGNSNAKFHVGAITLSLLFFTIFYIFPNVIIHFLKCKKVSNSNIFIRANLCSLLVLLFSVFMNIVSVLVFG